MADEEGVEIPARRRRRRKGRGRRNKDEGNEDENEVENVENEVEEEQEDDEKEEIPDEEVEEENDEDDSNENGGRRRRKRRDRTRNEEARDIKKKKEPVGNFKSRRAKLRAVSETKYASYKGVSSILAILLLILCFVGYFHVCMVNRNCMNYMDPAVPKNYTDTFMPFVATGVIFSVWSYGAAMSESAENLLICGVLFSIYSVIVFVYGVQVADLGTVAKSESYAGTVFKTFTAAEEKYYPSQQILSERRQQYAST